MKSARNKEQHKPLKGRRLARVLFGANTMLALLLALVLLGIVNYLSYQHYARADLSETRFYSLSEKTLQLLQTVTNRLDAYMLFPSDHALVDDVRNLLREYQNVCPALVVEAVDPNRDLARAELLSRELEGAQPAAVHFVYGGRTEIVDDRALVETELDEQGSGRRVAFRGEVEFSSAIRRLVSEAQPKVYVLRGHGERDINNFDPVHGFSQIARALRQDHMEVVPFLLGEQPGLPEDCDALLIAGPTRKFAQPELDILRGYLKRNGRLMVLLDAMTSVGLETVLEDWGVRLPEDVVVDSQHTLTGRELLVQHYAPHTITRRLSNVVCLFHLPRSVAPAEAAPAPGAAAPAERATVNPLAFSSELSWSESQPGQSPLRFDPGVDRPGPIPIAAAIEKGVAAGLAAELQPTRIVLFGDSDFAANGSLSGGNADLFLSAMNWLLAREEMIGIDAKTYQEYRLLMSRDQLRLLFGAVVLGLPGVVALAGLAMGLRRRK